MNMYYRPPCNRQEEQSWMPNEFPGFEEAPDMQPPRMQATMEDAYMGETFGRPPCWQDPFCKRVRQCLRPAPKPPRQPCPPPWNCDKRPPSWDCRDCAFCRRVQRCLEHNDRPWEDCNRPPYPPTFNCRCNCIRR